MHSKTNINRLSPLFQFLAGAILVVLLSVLIFNLLMSPPINDLMLMVQFLSITAVVSVLVGYLAYRVGWINRSPTIRWTILSGYALASGLTFLNVWVTARLMFASEHDLMLATVLLLFAGGIAMALGFFFSTAITDRLQSINQAVEQLTQGDLNARVWIEGQDELARLGISFNRMAERLQEADRQKKEAEIMRRDLIAWVSHDLQTPLASIRAMVEALADGVVEDQNTVNRYLETTQREIGSLSVLIDDLFQLAQLEAGGLELNCEYDSLSDLISDTLESFSALAKQRQVMLRGSISDAVDPVYMDVQRIGRVLNNLVSNGLRYTSPGGFVEVAARRTGEGTEVEVRDDGEGIPAEDLPFIFDRFYRSEKSRNRATGGSGLGLAIAQGIIEAHGGLLTAESQPGQTIFRLTLPPKAKI
jgi:signal transduction histidine kinase